jgi:hypothetical protein
VSHKIRRREPSACRERMRECTSLWVLQGGLGGRGKEDDGEGEGREREGEEEVAEEEAAVEKEGGREG